MTGRTNESAILNLDVCGSTNKEAMRLAQSGELGPLWVCATRQDEGRGRSGRNWVSEPGNLFASLLVRFPGPLAWAGQLSLVAGVAVVDAIRAVAKDRGVECEVFRLWLKWPNDIMVGAAKCGGLLVETSAAGRGGDFACVIGVGLNLAAAPLVEGRVVTCLHDQGLDVSPEELLGYLDRAMLSRLSLWDSGKGFAGIRSAWLSVAGEIGTPISVHEGTNVLEGTFAGLGEEGHLLLKSNGGELREVAWGDVVFP